MKNYKFSLSPAQELNLANKGLTYQNGKAVFNKETETELKSTIKKALDKRIIELKKAHSCTKAKELQEQKQLIDIKEETIFSGNKTFSEVLIEAVIFGISATFILTFLSAFIYLLINLIS